jgi:hypothetical protein
MWRKELRIPVNPGDPGGCLDPCRIEPFFVD